MDKRFLEMLRGLVDTDMHSLPNTKFLNALIVKLNQHGISYDHVMDIVACIEVDINEFDRVDPDWKEAVSLYAKLIHQLYYYYEIENNKHRIPYVFSKINLKYNL